MPSIEQKMESEMSRHLSLRESILLQNVFAILYISYDSQTVDKCTLRTDTRNFQPHDLF